MKKLTSLLLALAMVCSLSISALAAHTTTVTYTGTSGESYTITVPASLTPGASGEVKANGTWASNRTLVVTAPSTVTLTNNIDGGTKTLDVTFDGIKQVGNDTVSQTVSKTISVSSISNALFGTWSGVITYSVSMEDNGSTPAPTLISFSIDGTNYQAENGMSWYEWIDSQYNTEKYGVWVTNDGAWGGIFIGKYVSDGTTKKYRADENINHAYTIFGSFARIRAVVDISSADAKTNGGLITANNDYATYSIKDTSPMVPSYDDLVLECTSDYYELISFDDLYELSEGDAQSFEEAYNFLEELADNYSMDIYYFFYFKNYDFINNGEPCEVTFNLDDLFDVMVFQFIDGEWVELESIINGDGTITVNAVVDGPMAILASNN